jgi:type I restriction-modification system DNA methylase subunit
MTGNNKQQLEQQLWNIANTLRGKMGQMISGIIFLGLSFTSISVKECTPSFDHSV